MTLGNHESDDGDDLLADFLHMLKFPIISSNIHTKHHKLASALIPHQIYEKYKLAVIAVMTETTSTTSNPGNLTTFEDPFAVAKRMVSHSRNTTAISLYILTHIGYEKDIELAQSTTYISLIISGHSHTLIGNMTGAKGAYPTIATNLDVDEVFRCDYLPLGRIPWLY